MDIWEEMKKKLDPFGMMNLSGSQQNNQQQDSTGFNALDGLSFGNTGANSDFTSGFGSGNGGGINPGGDSWLSMAGFLGNDKQQGWGLPAVGLGSALMKGFLGWKDLGLQEDKFDFEKEAYNKNYANQVQSYNTQLANQANQKASATGDFAGAQDYINRHRLS